MRRTVVDPAGNLIGLVRAPEPAEGAIRLMAHLDEIAMVVKRIDEDGALRVFAPGGAYPVNFGMCPVDILGDNQVVTGALSSAPRTARRRRHRAQAITRARYRSRRYLQQPLATTARNLR